MSAPKSLKIPLMTSLKTKEKAEKLYFPVRQRPNPNLPLPVENERKERRTMLAVSDGLRSPSKICELYY